MNKKMEFISCRDIYASTLIDLGKTNKDIVVLDADLAKSTRTLKFGKVFPDRFFDLGVAEQNMMGVAAGLAASGKTAFASSFAMFASGRAWEQIRNTIAYSNLNVKIFVTHGGISVGGDGSSHQSLEDIALMRVLPQMRVLVPLDGYETEKAVRLAAKSPGPFYIRVSREKVPQLTKKGDKFILGKSSLLHPGGDVTIIAYGLMAFEGLKAEKILAQEGISVRLINMSTIKPIDEEAILQAAEETGLIVTAEEHSIIGGLGSAVAEFLSEKNPTPVIRIGTRDRFGQSGAPRDLFAEYHLLAKDIVAAVKKGLKIKTSAKKSGVEA